MKYAMPIALLNRLQDLLRLLIVLTFGTMMVLPGSGHAGEVLDDSKSPKRQYNTQFKWAYPGQAGSMDQEKYLLLEGTQSNVEVRLDTTDYIGHQARIYLGLPRQIQGINSTEYFTLGWKTNRFFFPGEVRPGNRTLIYDGLIETDIVVDLFTFTLRVNANHITGNIRYAPIFEIEPY